MSNVPLHLQQSFLEKRLVPLVGAGVSMSLTDLSGQRIFPNWRQLLENAAMELDEQCKTSHAQAVRAMLNINKYLDAADIAKEGLNGSLWSNFLKKTFDVEKSRIDDASLALPKEIWKLGNRIITLNFDCVLETALSGTDVRTIDNNNKSELADFSRNTSTTRSTVWHLHGSITNVESTIFTGASYEQLYGAETHYQAALAVFGEICKSETLLFIGCSLEDADLLRRISKISNIFSENCGPHYVLAREVEAAAVEEKLRGFPINVLTFSDFGQPLLDYIALIPGEHRSAVDELKIEHPKYASSLHNNIKKIAILVSQPLDYEIDHGELLREIGKIKCHKEYKHLTISNLNSLDGYDYIFILSTLLKGKISTENQWLTNERIDFSELIENLGQSSAKGIFVFLNEGFPYKHAITRENLTKLPIAIFPKLDKKTLGTAFFKLFKKQTIKLIDSYEACNEREFKLEELNEKNFEFKLKSNLSESIDPKTTNGFTGRVTDLQNIAKMMFELQGSDEIITIKGPGGIGKTATVKKLAVEMSKRNMFQDGISFIDCEFIKNNKVLEHNILRVFKLDEASDLKAQLRNNLSRQEKLIILDNIEALLYLSDRALILETLSLLSDYVQVLVTSRELLGLPNEKAYELKRLSTDEALALFLRNVINPNISLEDKKTIREHILENLLDNSPLAIKLVTKNLPSGKNYSVLARELENDLFSRVTEQDVLAFDQPSDLNVEKKRSLYASINYSYSKLNDKEKISFELLSLFPDGVDIESFKTLINKGLEHSERLKLLGNPAFNFIITDPIIRNLENKSLVETSNKLVRLQSLIGRFSEQKLQQREKAEIQRLHNNCFQFNKASAHALVHGEYDTRVNALSTFNKYQKNFAKCVSYLPFVSAPSIDICSFLMDLAFLAVNSCTSRLLINELDKLDDLFSNLPTENLLLEVAKVYCRYYDGDFSFAIERLHNILPEESMNRLRPEDWFEKTIAMFASDIYGLEGSTLNNIVSDARFLTDYNRYPDSLFRLGDFDEKLARRLDPHFFNFEVELALGTLQLEVIDKYIDSINERQRIELMQTNYTRTKLAGAPRINVDKLLVVNPYTAGIKSLIKALTSQGEEEKTEYFFAALPNLKHIKYYYTEALLLLSEHLYKSGSNAFGKFFEEGISLAKTYHFQYLTYRFEQVTSKEKCKYDLSNYPLPKDLQYSSLIQTIRSRQ